METFLSICGRNKKIIGAFFCLCFIVAGRVSLAQDEITLTVAFVGGGNSLDFGRLRNLRDDGTPATESATRQVRLAITPVVGNARPYVVTQVLTSELTQETGVSANPEGILYRVEQESGTAGEIRITSETLLSVGEQEIFRSAPTGGASQLLITYDLNATPEQEAGAYNGIMDYRVSLV